MPDRGGSLFSHGIGQFFDRSLHRAVPTNSGPINLETDTMRRVMRGPLFTPHWSPSGNRLVFHSPIPQYLFTVGTDGRNLQKLTGPDSPNLDLENTVIGKWSPSGERILFSVEAGEKSGIFTMNPDGSKVEKLVGWSLMPAWFPSGERVAYIDFDASDDRQVHVIDADGTDQRKLTDLKNSRDVGWPSVSPDGEQIAFTYDDQIYLMSANGTNVRQVTGERDLPLSQRGVLPERKFFSFAASPVGDIDPFSS